MRLAGELQVPFTSGILIGIGGDAAGADRVAAGPAGDPRGARPHPGADHPELPGQAGHEDGERARARLRGPALDAGDSAHPLRAGDRRAGAAQPDARLLRQAGGGGPERLGRRLAGHNRPREPGGALAPDRGVAAADGGGRSSPRRAAGGLPELRKGQRPLAEQEDGDAGAALDGRRRLRPRGRVGAGRGARTAARLRLPAEGAGDASAAFARTGARLEGAPGGGAGGGRDRAAVRGARPRVRLRLRGGRRASRGGLGPTSCGTW